MKVENVALKDRLATAQSEMTASDMAAKLDAALAGKSEAEGEQARLRSMVDQYVTSSHPSDSDFGTQ
jgi:hypothetical protein